MKNLAILPSTLLVGTMMGSTLVVSRYSLIDWEPLNFVGFRLLLAAVVFLPLYLVTPAARGKRDAVFWKHGLVWALFGTAIPMMLTVFSLSYQSSGVTSLLTSMNPAVVALEAHFFLHDERLTWRRVVGIVLALIGTGALIVGGESGLADAPLDWRGPVLVVIAVLCASSSLVYARRYMRQYHHLDLAMSRIMLAAPIVVIVAVVVEGLRLEPIMSQRGALGLAYAGLVGTLGGLVVGIGILKRFGATYAVQTGYVQPVVAILCGIVFLNESLSLTIGLAISLIICGIWLTNNGIVAKTEPMPA